MREEDIPKNSMVINMSLTDTGDMRMAFGHNFDVDEVDEDSIQYLLDVLNGIRIAFDAGMEQFAQQGAMARMIQGLIEDLDGPEIEFEPDEELLDALNRDNNIVPFNKKRLN